MQHHSPALRRLDEAALRDRLREAYYLLKEKERNLFLAATVGQELVETNQQLQESYEKLHTELIETQQRLDNEPKPGDGANRLTDDGNPTDRSLDNEKSQSSRLHGRRRSMALQVSAAKPAGSTDAADKGAVLGGDVEKEWMKLHVQPLKAQLLMAQERTDELLAEREELAAQVYSLRQEHSAAVRRSNESTAAVEQGRRIIERLEEDKARAECELEAQRAFWAKRWSDHQAECKAGALAEEQAHGAAQRHAEDAAARIRAEQRADELQLRYSAAQAETELLRSQMQRVEEERVNEWEPMRAQWLGCESALQELHETHQSTCEALAQAEARLAELDKSTQLNDPLKPKTEKASTSLLGELDLERHQAVAQRQALVREHMVLKRALAFVVNDQAASTSGDNHPESSSPITNATEEPTNTMPQAQPKRRRVSGTPSSHGGGGRTSSTSKTNTASVPAKDSNALFEFNDAADRGMKSCLDTLGTVHAAAAIPMSGHQQSELPSSVASEHSTAGTAASPDSASRESSSAKEIYVGSRSSQKQIECNNQ
ncbi:hypothetical protein GGI12_001037 [Dipsacomyces acuminosporus]|nr:hypothetical protein GGI12_001037 [Dipsacomyces acuminosporus]